MIINMFLLACEVFTEFYTDSAHVASARYLYFGLHGRHALVPWIWTAIGMNLVATVLLMLPASRGLNMLNVACVLSIVGIWIEKGMGLIVPAFVPTPLGEIVEYTPTLTKSWSASASGRSDCCSTPSSSASPCPCWRAKSPTRNVFDVQTGHLPQLRERHNRGMKCHESIVLNPAKTLSSCRLHPGLGLPSRTCRFVPRPGGCRRCPQETKACVVCHKQENTGDLPAVG